MSRAASLLASALLLLTIGCSQPTTPSRPVEEGTTEWVSEETPFFLKAGENPDNVKLNLVINGKGTAWIDDIHLIAGPL